VLKYISPNLIKSALINHSNKIIMLNINQTEIIANMRTLNDMLRYAVSLLNHSELYYGHGYANSMEEAIQIITHSLNLNYADYTDFKYARLLDADKQKILDLLIERCYTRKPLAYLIRKAPFQGLDFYIDERVIVPRSFIGELLADDQLLPFLTTEPKRILDICTGSGCLSIIAAHVFDDAYVDALDISTEALDVAKINIDKFKLQQRIRTYQSDVYNTFGQEHFNQYDIIISNPPYVNAKSMKDLPREYQQEPEIALHGGEDGMGILMQAKLYLKPQGILILEIGNEYKNLVRVFPKLKLTWLPVSAGEEQVFLMYAKDL
jgi:ribosomal protein L3 glutamine methyltransferase